MVYPSGGLSRIPEGFIRTCKGLVTSGSLLGITFHSMPSAFHGVLNMTFSLWVRRA